VSLIAVRFWHLSVTESVALPPYQGVYMSLQNNRTPFDLKTFLTTAGAGKTVLQFKKDHRVFSQGDAVDKVFYIQSGQIKVTVVSQQGKEAVVALLEAGQFFGEGCLNDEPLCATTTTATGECVITSIAKDEMNSALRREPELVRFFSDFLIARNVRIGEDLIEQLFNSSERRLARLLLVLANYGNEGGTKVISSKMSHETLADMIGITPSQVGVFMNKFRALGFIDDGDKIEVHDALLQAVLHDAPELKTHD
jgi:CRP/FNR family cyclic AMP-dependent transcriptional regulator